jgi:hypothetical protein
MTRATTAAVAVLAMALCSPAVLAQQRDARAVATGTAAVTGVVWSAGGSPHPMRRVVVSISGGGLPDARSVITDDDGRFAFERLPAGTFTVVAKKPAYLQATFGASRPGQPGSSIALVAGQRVAVNLTIFKGSVIAGVLQDASGRPAAGVPVVAVPPRQTGMNTATFQPLNFTTDDRGAFRIYGLLPGEYVLVAAPPPNARGAIGAISTTAMDAILTSLAQRGAATAPMPDIARAGFAPVYFPGTTFFSEAQTIVLLPEGTREGVNFRVSHVPVARIEGTIAGEVSDFSAVEISIILPGPRIPGLTGGGITSTRPNAQGEFAYDNVPPGEYRIMASARRGPSDGTARPAATGRGGGMGGSAAGGAGRAQTPFTGERLFALTDVVVRGEDVKGVSLPLQLGGSLAGRIVFDESSATRPTDLSTISVHLTQTGNSAMTITGGTMFGTSLAGVPAAGVNPDGTFRMLGIGPSSYTMSVALPAALRDVWTVRSAMADGRDLLDGTLHGPDVRLDEVVVTLSDRRSGLSGTLQSAAGLGTAEYFVVAFSVDRAHWQTLSRRSKYTRPDTNGRFTFDDLPPGEYFLAALTDLDPRGFQDAAFLEQVAPAAVKVTIAEGEVKVQDLRIR